MTNLTYPALVRSSIFFINLQEYKNNISPNLFSPFPMHTENM